MHVVRDNLWLCVDCLMYACNGDTSGIDDPKREARVVKGVDDLGPHLVPNFDSNTLDGIRGLMDLACEAGLLARCGCDACGSNLDDLPQTMHRFAVLGSEEP